MNNTAQAQATEVQIQVSFREWISLKDAVDCLEELGVKNYYPVARGDEVTLIVTVPSDKCDDFKRKIGTQPEVDTVQVVKERRAA